MADERRKSRVIYGMTNTDKTSSLSWTIVFICWLIACVSALGSLFFSEIMDFPPCSMCWYQRIFMYPLVILFLIGLFPFDRSVIKYTLPISSIGCGFALYHTLLYYGYIPENMQPCSQGVSCAEKYLEVFGFISIPMLSLMAFITITALLIFLRRKDSK